MKFFLIKSWMSSLADDESLILLKVRDVLLIKYSFQEVNDPELADILLIQEKQSFKNFRYIKNLLEDSLISQYANKVLTINNDDCATGLLRGLYTSIPKSRYNTSLHVSVPYINYPNEIVFHSHKMIESPQYLAGWRGNPKSSTLRKELYQVFKNNSSFCLENTQSWLNHSQGEKEHYLNLMLNAKFSLCPTGWAPVSFRIYESMALGRCPVVIADDFVPPEGPNWEKFSLFLPQRKINSLYDFLLQYEKEWCVLGRRALEAWDEHFNSEAIVEYYAQSLQKLLKITSIESPEKEIKRWNSFQLHWSNKWTIPQRAINKIRSIAHNREK